MSDWYYVSAGAQAGPVGPDELRRLARSGAIGPDTYVWTSGMGAWQRAREQSWYEPPGVPPVGGDGPRPGPPPPPGPDVPAHPPELSPTTRNWAVAAHLSAFGGALLGIGALVFLGPLVVWLVKREEHPFIAEHAREALNFNLSVLVYGVISVLLLLVLVGFLLLLALVVFWLVVTILAAVRAANGQEYHYPLSIPFVSG